MVSVKRPATTGPKKNHQQSIARSSPSIRNASTSKPAPSKIFAARWTAASRFRRRLPQCVRLQHTDAQALSIACSRSTHRQSARAPTARLPHPAPQQLQTSRAHPQSSAPSAPRRQATTTLPLPADSVPSKALAPASASARKSRKNEPARESIRRRRSRFRQTSIPTKSPPPRRRSILPPNKPDSTDCSSLRESDCCSPTPSKIPACSYSPK